MKSAYMPHIVKYKTCMSRYVKQRCRRIKTVTFISNYLYWSSIILFIAVKVYSPSLA